MLDAQYDTCALDDVRRAADALDLVFISAKCSFFKSWVSYHRGNAQALDGIKENVRLLLNLGCVNFVSQELMTAPKIAMVLLASLRDPIELGALFDALARHYAAPAILAEACTLSEAHAAVALEMAEAHLPRTAVKGLAATLRRSRSASARRFAARILADGKSSGRAGSNPFPELTQRELEILGLIADGLSNSELAHRLCLSPATVKTHVNHIFTKLGTHDRVQSVLMYRNRVAPQAP